MLLKGQCKLQYRFIETRALTAACQTSETEAGRYYDIVYRQTYTHSASVIRFRSTAGMHRTRARLPKTRESGRGIFRAPMRPQRESRRGPRRIGGTALSLLLTAPQGSKRGDGWARLVGCAAVRFS